jgi:hypothetical protein
MHTVLTLNRNALDEEIYPYSLLVILREGIISKACCYACLSHGSIAEQYDFELKALDVIITIAVSSFRHVNSFRCQF